MGKEPVCTEGRLLYVDLTDQNSLETRGYYLDPSITGPTDKLYGSTMHWDYYEGSKLKKMSANMLGADYSVSSDYQPYSDLEQVAHVLKPHSVIRLLEELQAKETNPTFNHPPNRNKLTRQ